jgi:hypothetical protein
MMLRFAGSKHTGTFPVHLGNRQHGAKCWYNMSQADVSVVCMPRNSCIGCEDVQVHV